MDDQFLTKSDLFGLKREPVDLPGKGKVYVQELGGDQLLEYKETLERLKAAGPEVGFEGGLDLMGLLVSMSACDQDGKLLFTREEIPSMRAMSLDVLKTLSAKAMDLSGMKEQADSLKSGIEEQANELKKSLSDSSSTDLPTS